MRCILETACGCRQEIEKKGYDVQLIHVPIRSGSGKIRRRTFRLWSHRPDIGSNGQEIGLVATFREVVK